MLSWYVSLLGIALQLVLVSRGLQSGNFRRFPYFFAYIASGVVQSVVGYFFLLEHPRQYAAVFWPMQFISLFIGCGVVVEIFGHVLAAYPGAAKFAKLMCTLVFVLTFLSAGLYLRLVPSATWLSSEVELERNLRTVQSLALMAILGSIFYFAITLGRNMQGMIAGYGIYLGTSVASLAMRLALGPKADIWRTIRPFSFDVALMVWVVCLWSYSPSPFEEPSPPMASDYQSLMGSTQRGLAEMRSQIGRSVRS